MRHPHPLTNRKASRPAQGTTREQRRGASGFASFLPKEAASRGGIRRNPRYRCGPPASFFLTEIRCNAWRSDDCLTKLNEAAEIRRRCREPGCCRVADTWDPYLTCLLKINSVNTRKSVNILSANSSWIEQAANAALVTRSRVRVRGRSFASFWSRLAHFRSTPDSRHIALVARGH